MPACCVLVGKRQEETTRAMEDINKLGLPRVVDTITELLLGVDQYHELEPLSQLDSDNSTNRSFLAKDVRRPASHIRPTPPSTFVRGPGCDQDCDLATVTRSNEHFRVHAEMLSIVPCDKVLFAVDGTTYTNICRECNNGMPFDQADVPVSSLVVLRLSSVSLLQPGGLLCIGPRLPSARLYQAAVSTTHQLRKGGNGQSQRTRSADLLSNYIVLDSCSRHHR
nr:hypothetical protein CFP56_00996 [Quercus suber]